MEQGHSLSRGTGEERAAGPICFCFEGSHCVWFRWEGTCFGALPPGQRERGSAGRHLPPEEHLRRVADRSGRCLHQKCWSLGKHLPSSGNGQRRGAPSSWSSNQTKRQLDGAAPFSSLFSHGLLMTVYYQSKQGVKQALGFLEGCLSHITYAP